MEMNNRKLVSLLSGVGALVLLASICSKNCLADGTPSHKLLQLPDFKLESRVRVLSPGTTKFDEELELTEYYSNVQRRARLDIQTIQRSSGSTNANVRGLVYFYRNQNSREYLRLNAKPMIYSTECNLVDPSTFTKDLFGLASSLNGKSVYKQWLDERSDVPDYVIGLARLLLIVDSNKYKLEPTTKPYSLIRNQKARKYTLKDKIMSKDGDDLTKLIVYYPDNDALESGTNLPLRIWFITPDFAEIIVDYTFEGSVWPGPSDPINESNNFFSFPAGLGCSKDLKTAVSPDPKQVPDVFSFRFERESLSDDAPIARYFVAYDGYASAARLDKMDQLDLDKRTEGGEYSITIGDIQRNRYFNIRQPVNGMFGEQPKIDSSSNNNQCAASLLVPDDPEGFYHELTLPFDQMVEIGTHVVRGIETRTFEQVTNQLPALFFPKLWYRNPRSLKYEYVDDTKTSKSPWVVVYFFTSKTNGTSFRHEQFGQLLRVDVIKSVLKMIEFRFEVYDFKWALQMAPNGDNQDELFALRDRCSQVVSTTGLTQDRYANLEMEAEYDPKEVGHTISRDEAIDFIKWPSTRRQELTRALVMSNSLGATNLYDLESRMKPIGSNRLLLKLEAKLVDLSRQPVFEAVFMGYGTMIQSQTITTATDVDECFWDAVHRMRQLSREVLFSFCFQACVIDSTPEFKKNSETSAVEYFTSSVFKISQNQLEKVRDPCDIMRVQQLIPSENVSKDQEKDKRFMWKFIFFNLNRRRLFLPLANQGADPNTVLTLQIKQIELSNSRWSEDVGRQVDDAKPEWDDKNTLAGLSLSLGVFCERVMPPPLKLPTSLEDLEDLNDNDRAPMSYELCQANCMADMSCRSFSLCTVKSEIVCLKSELEFRQPELLDRIASLADPLKQANKRGNIKLTMEPSDDLWGLESSEKNKSQEKHVELRVDKRCRLYNKSALQMFKFARFSESLKVKDSNLMGVDSEEQCAERCIRINLNFFKRAAKVRVRGLLNKGNKQQDELLKEMLSHQETNLGTWCKGFDYINLVTASLSNELKSSLGSSKTKKNGLCRVRRGSLVAKLNNQPTQTNTTQVEEQTRKLEVRSGKYDLIYSNLYEKRPGFRMRNRWPPELNDKHGEIPLDKLVEKMPNHNRQIVIKKGSVDDCARACFLQTIGMTPPCKSFGVSREPTNANQKLRNPNEAYCILNSMTLDDALKSGESKELIIELSNVPEHVMMHYDPKSVYNLDNLIMVNLLMHEKNSLMGRIRYFRMSSFGLSILIVISLATGLWLGLSQGQRYLNKVGGRRESVSSPSRSFLNSLVGNNQVSHHRFEPEIDLPDIKDI